jgi:co-chaperonin GroES (HSP10)
MLQYNDLKLEIEDIIKSGSNDVFFSYQLVFLLDGEEIPVYKVLDMSFERDYTASLGDDVTASIMINGQTYYQTLYPNRDRLYAIIRRERVAESGVILSDDDKEETDELLFRAFLPPEGDPTFKNNRTGESTPHAQGQLPPKQVELQLVNPVVDNVLKQTVGSIFYREKPSDVLRAMLTIASKKVKTEELFRIKGVDMVDPDNTKVREHIVIQPGTPVRQLHNYIQRHCGGIYNQGIGSYIQGDRWYVYPKYNHHRFDKSERTLVLVNIPPDKSYGIERTFRVKDKTVIALLTGETEEADVSEIKQLNMGNGVIYGKASAIFESFTEADGNKADVTSKNNIRRYVTSERRNADNFQFISDDRITDNDFYQLSKISDREGRYVVTKWQNSDPELIYPGMPIQMWYMQGGDMEDIQTLDGTIVKAEHDIVSTGKGMQTGNHICISTLTCFVKHSTG